MNWSTVATAVVGSLVAFLVTSFVSLAVWSVRQLVRASDLQQDAKRRELELSEKNARLELELKLANQNADIVTEFRALVHGLEDKLQLRGEVRQGFARVNESLGDLSVRLPIKADAGARA